MTNIINLIGRRLGKLVVVSYFGKVKGRAAWNCVCDCGNEKVISTEHINRVKSCGCFQLERTSAANRTHGHTKTRTYRIWTGMKQRCSNQKTNSYADYGGRGIKVCDRWLHSFENFLADMGECPPGLEIDRADNDGNYEPGNCQWATEKTQANNRRQGAYKTAKLGEKDVIAIRSETKQTRADYKRQAKNYGVSWQAIDKIMRRNTWRHI